MKKSLDGKFLISAAKLSQCPDYGLPEIALIGRSDVGKSSFINGLANNKKLAKTSNTPGKTRLINFFNFSNKFIITDLPGYGYARVSQGIKDDWQKNLEQYLLKREQIVKLVQFVDARHEIQKNDYQMREWINHHGLNTVTVLSKVDLVKQNDLNKRIQEVKKNFGSEVLLFTAKNNRYNEEVIKYIFDNILYLDDEN